MTKKVTFTETTMYDIVMVSDKPPTYRIVDKTGMILGIVTRSVICEGRACFPIDHYEWQVCDSSNVIRDVKDHYEDAIQAILDRATRAPILRGIPAVGT